MLKNKDVLGFEPEEITHCITLCILMDSSFQLIPSAWDGVSCYKFQNTNYCFFYLINVDSDEMPNTLAAREAS